MKVSNGADAVDVSVVSVIMNTEMDKIRDMRRGRGGGGTSRFSQQKLLAGLEKPKKERLVKKLSVVDKAASSSFEGFEMGCSNNISLSDRENETASQSHSSMSNTTAKRFKLPKKFLDDCNGVDHSSVPRKLRSAMKKRNRESVSPPLPDSKKLNHTIGGVESLEKDGLKKFKKQGILDWCQKQTVGPITKDEEEVVETLYAMAGMFPDNDSGKRSIFDSTPSEAKPPALAEHREIPTPAINDSAITKEDSGSSYPFRTDGATSPSNVETSQNETAKVTSLKEPCAAEEKPDLHNSNNFHMKTDGCVPPKNVHSTMPLLAKKEHNDDKTSRNPVNFQVLPELCLDSGLEQSTEKETSCPRKPELAFGTATFRSQLVQQDIVTESRKNGLALWPGLSLMVMQGAGSPGPSASKIPAWLDAPVGASKHCSLENGPSTGKVYKGATNRKHLKRCAAHVYISRLIHEMQMPENNEKSPLECNQLKTPHEVQRQGTMVIDDIDRVKKGLNGVISGKNIGSTTVERNSSEAGSGILQYKRLHQDQLQTATASGLHSRQKQSINFLSLSAGGGGAEATNSFNRTRNNRLEPSSQFQVSYLLSLPQHHKFMPIHYTSSSYPSKLSPSGTASTQQVQLQLPPYLGSPLLSPAHTKSTIFTKQHQYQQQQLWAAQLAAQYRHTGHSTAMSDFPNWPNERLESSPISCPLSITSHSPSSMEILGPKYSPISQQQQLMAIASSLPSERLKRQDHHLPLVYEEIEGGFRTGGSLPLQLLCNEKMG